MLQGILSKFELPPMRAFEPAYLVASRYADIAGSKVKSSLDIPIGAIRDALFIVDFFFAIGGVEDSYEVRVGNTPDALKLVLGGVLPFLQPGEHFRSGWERH
jgi:hypothetical protein